MAGPYDERPWWPQDASLEPARCNPTGQMPGVVYYANGKIWFLPDHPGHGGPFPLVGDLMGHDSDTNPVQEVVDGYAEEADKAEYDELEEDGFPWRLTRCSVCMDDLADGAGIWLNEHGPRTCDKEQCQDIASRVAAELMDRGWIPAIGRRDPRRN
jgi:hypothetical protein